VSIHVFPTLKVKIDVLCQCASAPWRIFIEVGANRCHAPTRRLF
jgi:hypothetical protein